MIEMFQAFHAVKQLTYMLNLETEPGLSEYDGIYGLVLTMGGLGMAGWCVFFLGQVIAQSSQKLGKWMWVSLPKNRQGPHNSSGSSPLSPA